MTSSESGSSKFQYDPIGSRAAGRRGVTRIGFVGLTDAAPLLVANDLGLFERHGLKVSLSREAGWATIRDKVVYGELEAAHALCSLPFLATIGSNSISTPCVSGLILSRGGNAIILSQEMWRRGVRDDDTLRTDVENRRYFRKYILATVFPCSTHDFVLREWLTRAGVDPNTKVQLVTLPPSQMCRNLAAGTIDGFCVGDPWARLAIAQGIGWSPATSVDISPNHPEKVLMVNGRFAENHREEHIRVVAALIEACAICDVPKNRKAIARLISEKRRVNCPPELLEASLSSEFNYGMQRMETKPGFMRFHSGEANRPGRLEADWILDRISSSGVELSPERIAELREQVFRLDVYEEARLRADTAVAYERGTAALSAAAPV